MKIDLKSRNVTRPPFNGATLFALRNTQSIDLSLLAAETNLPLEQLRRFEQGEAEPTPKQAEILAKKLGVSQYLFYRSKTPDFDDRALDFRRHDDSSLISPAGARAIESVRSRLRYAAKFLDLSQTVVPLERSPEADGETVRRALKLSTEIQLSFETQKDLFRYIRHQIEELGILTFSVSAPTSDFRGFAIQELSRWAVGFNSKEWSWGARSFTLVHELVHVFIGTPGLSDPFRPSNSDERFCNKVASLALAPARLLLRLAEQNPRSQRDEVAYVKYAANKLNISLHMTAIRLEEEKLVDEGFAESWLAKVKASGKHPDQATQGGSAGPTAQDEGKTKISHFGSLLPQLIDKAIRDKKLHRNDSLKLFGLKYKYLSDSVSAAQERAAEQSERASAYDS